MRTYLAGPMRGIPLYNFPSFDAAAADLRSQGIIVTSPAEMDREAGFDPVSLPANWDWRILPDHFSLDAAIRRDFNAILSGDAIHLLPGWQNSTGAKAELGIARWRGLGVFEYQPSARQVVGLFGYYGSGKDEAAKALTDLGWQRLAFADPVRAMALAIDPVVDSIDDGEMVMDCRLSRLVDLRGWTEAKRNPEVRRLLQRVGTEAVRNIIGPQTWIDIAERAMPADKSVVFTDVRFPNEVELIRKYGGKLIQIRRPGCKPAQSHVSEEYPFEPDATIINDGTIAELHEKVRTATGARDKAALPLDCRERDRLKAENERRVVS